MTHIYFVGVGYDLVTVEHPLTTTLKLSHDEANEAQALELMRHPKFVPTAEGWQDRDLRRKQNVMVVAKM